MTRMRHITLASALAVLAAACGSSGTIAADGQATYEVDPLWPQPLPSSWILGSVTGVAVDSTDNVWIVHRGAASLTGRTEAALNADPPGAETCCMAAPAVLKFDQAGNLLAWWGGPGDGYAWPQSPGGIDVDDDGNVWIAASGGPPPSSGRVGGRGGRGGGRFGGRGGGRGGRGGGRGGGAQSEPPAGDAHVLKFSGDGSHLMTIGTPGQTGAPDSTTELSRPADVAVDGGEVFVADSGNRRVVVFDASTGDYLRHWGAYGETPDAADPGPYDPGATPARQFLQVNCVEVGPDGLVYVCDRNANRIQAFDRDGTFVREVVVSTSALGNGAAWDVAFADSGTLLVANGQEQHVIVVHADRMEATDMIGSGGRWPGAFYAVGSVAVDSAGNFYTGETLEGKRVQKFVRR